MTSWWNQTYVLQFNLVSIQNYNNTFNLEAEYSPYFCYVPDYMRGDAGKYGRVPQSGEMHLFPLFVCDQVIFSFITYLYLPLLPLNLLLLNDSY